MPKPVEWIVYAEHPVEVVDQAVLIALANSGGIVTVWRLADERPARAVDGVKIIYRPTARADFYRALQQNPTGRSVLIGPVTILPWRLPPSTRPIWVLSDQTYIPLINQLFPIVELVVVSSKDLKKRIAAARSTFPLSQVVSVSDFVHSLKIRA